MDHSILNSFLVLSAFIVVLFLLSLYLKKIQKAKFKKIGNYEGKVLDKIPLTQKASLYIVKVGEQSFLIGLADKNITLISELNPSEQASFELPNNTYKTNKPINQSKIDMVQPIDNQSLSFTSFLKSAFSKNN